MTCLQLYINIGCVLIMKDYIAGNFDMRQAQKDTIQIKMKKVEKNTCIIKKTNVYSNLL